MSRFTILLASSLLAVPAASLGQQIPTTSVTANRDRLVVSYADLDIAGARGQRILQRRIDGAIEQVCGSFANVTDWIEEDHIQGCRSAAWASANRQLASRPADQKVALAARP